MSYADVVCLGIALLALIVAAVVVIQMYRHAAGFFGSAARFQDAIENRALRLVQRTAPSPEERAEPVLAGVRVPVPEMPEVLRTKWRERTQGSNIPDAFDIPQEV